MASLDQLNALCGHKAENGSEEIYSAQLKTIDCLTRQQSFFSIRSMQDICSLVHETKDDNANSLNPTTAKLLNLLDGCWTDEKPELDVFTYIIIAILSGIIVVNVLATLIYPCDRRRVRKDEIKLQEKNATSFVYEEPVDRENKFLLAFSISENLKSWSNTSLQDDDRHLRCVNGLKFLSMCWVILLFTFLLCPLQISRELIQSYPAWSMYLVLTAHFAADTFFTISGLLLSYRTLNGLANNESILRPFIRRLFRFWPVYAIIIFTSATIVPFFRENNSYLLANSKNCREQWWTNLLFINNIVHSESSTTCHQETWYLANDMQFFVFGLVLVYILWIWRVLGFAFILVLIGGAIAYPTTLTATDELIPSPVKLIYQNLTYEQMSDYVDFYIKPWNRAGPYLVGIVGGYLLSLWGNEKPSKPSAAFAMLGWSISTIGALALIYGLHISHSPEEVIPKTDSAIYGGLKSISWGCIIVWIVIACNQGYGGWINAFLSWSAFIPLSRLTFTTFLVSTNVQLVFHLFHVTHLPSALTMVGYFFTHLMGSLLLALVLHVLVQNPFQMGNKSAKSNDDGAEDRVPRERHGIYYTGTDMEVRVNVGNPKKKKKNRNKAAAEDEPKRQRPTVRYGMYYDGLKNDTVIDIQR